MPARDEKPDPNAPTAHDGPHGTPQGKKPPSERPGGPTSLIGTTLSGRYRIEKLLGEGGMGAVYQAEHTHMRKRMAIKVLHAEMSRMSEVVARFEREAMAAAHIDHPNVAAATDFGKLDDGSFFLALEFVEGQSLRDVVCEGPMALGRALHITRQIASALSRAHSLGIVHRDLKPENVMLVEREGDPDFAKVLDFGIAKVPVGELAQSSGSGPGAQVLTQAGMVYGTPEYMAPEQALGQPVDQRADLYALGIMSYEMLTGHRPFNDDSKVKLLGMHVTAPVPPMATTAPDTAVPSEVEAIILRLLAKESSERTADAKELIDELQTAASQLLAQGKLEASQVARIAPPTGSHARPSSVPGVDASTPRLATPLATQMQTGSVDRPRANGKVIAIGVVAAIVLLMAALSVTAITLGGNRTGPKPLTSARPSSSVPSASASASAKSPVPQRSIEERVGEALKLFDRGDYATGIEKLQVIDAEVEGRADVHEGLMNAYLATHKPADAMREASSLLRAKPSAADDIKVRVAVRDAAIATTQDKEAADIAFRLLEDAMGTTGLDDLFDIGYGRSGAQYPDAAKRAQRELAKPQLREKMSPALQVTLDVVVAGATCNVKKHLERAGTDGDSRTLAFLKTIKVGPKSTGFRRDPLGCLRDDALPKAIKALEARVDRK